MDIVDADFLTQYNGSNVSQDMMDNIKPNILTQDDGFNVSHQTNMTIASSSYVSAGAQRSVSHYMRGTGEPTQFSHTEAILESAKSFERSRAFPEYRKRERSPSPSIKQEEDDSLRLKNREAAQRYRAKKRRLDAQLAQELHQLRQINAHLQNHVHHLSNQVADLRQLLSWHEQFGHNQSAVPMPEGYGHQGFIIQAANYARPNPGQVHQPSTSELAAQTPDSGLEMNFEDNDYH